MFVYPRDGMRAEYREEPCRSALNRVRGMPFAWSLNPYMGCAHRCTFCYVRAFEARADRPSDDRYGTSIRVKTNVADVLRRELARASWQCEPVAVGAATDPYQPAEGRYRLTRACIEAFRDAASPFSIITRGPLIVRDVDVLAEASRRAEVVREARAAGATGIWANLLHLQPGTREHFLAALERDWPELLPRYEELYRRGAYLPRRETDPVRERVCLLARSHGIRDRRRVRLEPVPPAEQLRIVTT